MRRITTAVCSLSLLFSGYALAAEKVAFVPQIIGIPYFQAMEAGGKRAASDLGVEFVYSGPVDTNPMDQLQIVQNLIAQKVNAIGISVLDASSIAPVLAQAKANNVHLFTSDSDAPDSGRPVYVAQATDQGLGDTIIDEMVKRVGDHGKIGIVSGEATASNLNSWIGFMQQRVKSKYPHITLLKPQYAGGSASRAAQIATDLMSANPDIKGLIAMASTTCPGVAQAIETAGKNGKVIGSGFCSPNTARAYLKSGAFGYTVLWDPEKLGYLTVWAGKQLIDGKAFSAENRVPGFAEAVKFDSKTGVLLLGSPAVFTKENVDQFKF
ncbi:MULTISPECIES: autoinducer 2 ABC transporter substrate-binding protein [Pantoea]|uniref:Autoinducer 2 ABC transporter substrate-binding protein n=1 Tax=Pantoea endophytica TaxID=92488 RepID=A0ABX4SXE7_9GAMM|nr:MULTISPECIES: autoinducer 2 ABC transporter substrate-binding protein [Pantoea]PLR26042.1 autoinducer 2 ABC transporter substrate-binding protein [Pantoea endophytica]PYG49344.1 monosaccharide ABC transporter substrate-binding protein (CUT2 family) [Pantoea sp. AG1095]